MNKLDQVLSALASINFATDNLPGAVGAHGRVTAYANRPDAGVCVDVHSGRMTELDRVDVALRAQGLQTERYPGGVKAL